jgi:hypothetical protein
MKRKTIAAPKINPSSTQRQRLFNGLVIITQIEAKKYKQKHTPKIVIKVVTSPMGAFSGTATATITL